MNKQRKVLITTTYNEMGIIIDANAEEVTRTNLQPTCTPLTTDTISRQQAIDALAKQMPTPYTPDGSHPADEQIFQAQEVYADCITTLESLPTVQPEPQWIPVSERLPEEPGYYITSNEYNGVGEDFYYDGHFYNADKNAYEVLAWMPKPEHYKPNK